MMDQLEAECLARGIHEIRGYYYPTAKNKMVKDFYALEGFTKLSEDAEGNTVWSLSLHADSPHRTDVIAVNAEE